MNKIKLRQILRESIRSVLLESATGVPWFIKQFIDDFGTEFNDISDPSLLKNFKVQLMGGTGRGYVFDKVRVVYLQPEGTWKDDLDPAGAYQMVYSLAKRGHLPSKSTTDPQLRQKSADLYYEYKSQCEALGIEVLRDNDRKYSKVPYVGIFW
jgi:hypothetical protein